MPEWMELELAEALRPAAAPPELWQRIRATRGMAPEAVRRRPAWAAWPVAAIVTIVLAAGTLWLAALPGSRAVAPARAPQYSDSSCLLCHTS